MKSCVKLYFVIHTYILVYYVTIYSYWEMLARYCSKDVFICVYDVTYSHQINAWAPCQIRKTVGAHAPGMPGTFSPQARGSDPDMHQGTCITHVPWCMPGSLTSGFLWSRRRKRVSGIPGACTTRNVTYLVRGTCTQMEWLHFWRIICNG